jgi:hypothetical protein
MQVVAVTIYTILVLALFLQSSECSRVRGDATDVSCSTLGKQSKSDVEPKYYTRLDISPKIRTVLGG